MSPVISILTPSFNRADLYHETLASLRAQTYSNWEEVVVDDGSEADCWRQMQEITRNESRVTLIQRDREPKGACACRNIGVERCRGEYLVFLDTDDLLAPYCLEQRVAVMEQNPELDLAIFPCEIFNRVPGDAGRWWNIETDRDLLTRQFHQDGICQGTGCIWRKSSFVKLGMWGEDLAVWQDVDLFLRAWIQGYKFKVCFDLPADLLYREHESLSRTGYHTRPKVESRCRVIKNAVQLMENTGRSSEKSLARFIVGETVYGAARGRQFDLAKDLLQWGRESGVLSNREATTLHRAVLACEWRLIRFSAIQRRVESSLNGFSVISNLGKIPTSEPLIQRN